jgi:hypothetical protein
MLISHFVGFLFYNKRQEDTLKVFSKQEIYVPGTPILHNI